MEGIMVDELRLYRGDSYRVNAALAIQIPTLGQICDYGEADYFSMVNLFTSTPADLLWQLDDMGVDYTKITDWELFYHMLHYQFTPEMTGVLFGKFDFSMLGKYEDPNTKEKSLVLLSQGGMPVVGGNGEPVVFDHYTYMLTTDVVRKIHGLKKNEKRPANEKTKRILIDDARDEYLMSKNKEFHSTLKNLVSAMVNSEGFKPSHADVWGMNIYAFLDSVKRVTKIKEAGLLLQSGYSGFGIDLKKINNEQLNWLGEL